MKLGGVQGFSVDHSHLHLNVEFKHVGKQRLEVSAEFNTHD